MFSENFGVCCEQLAQMCPGIEGAVFADADGLIVASWGELAGDAAAAAAAQLVRSIAQNLSLIQESELDDALMWSSSGIWYCLRLRASGHALLIRAAAKCRSGALRMAVNSLRQVLSQSEP